MYGECVYVHLIIRRKRCWPCRRGVSDANPPSLCEHSTSKWVIESKHPGRGVQTPPPCLPHPLWFRQPNPLLKVSMRKQTPSLQESAPHVVIDLHELLKDIGSQSGPPLVSGSCCRKRIVLETRYEILSVMPQLCFRRNPKAKETVANVDIIFMHSG